MDSERLLQRFLRYVQIDTTACEGAATYPSSAGQLTLGRMLVDELRAMGITDVLQNEFGIVLATVPATRPHAPAIAFCAHLDTSPETTGAGVKPQVIRSHSGGELVLPGDPTQVIRDPQLAQLKGATIITSDGTTLLGADDKAGVAVIMEMAAVLMEEPQRPRGPVRLCFTCDEEIGRGVEHLDPQRVAAVACYTLDGSGMATIDVETFSADLAVVTVRGVNIHPSIAKGRMVNALRVAADLVARLPRDRLAPECTEGRQGFLHPYHVEGGVGQVELRILLRDFDTRQLDLHAQQLRQAAAASMAAFPGSAIDVAIHKQYRNMSEGLAREPRAVAYAETAWQRLGATRDSGPTADDGSAPAQETRPRLGGHARRSVIRGGTDGSRLTELGLPTPNLSTGQHTPHSNLEWACLDEMQAAVLWLLEICAVWAEPAGDARECGVSG